MRSVVRLNHAVEAITAHRLPEPLSAHLKRYFNKNRNVGANDRRVLRALVYHYYRLGGARQEFAISKSIIIGHFLCSVQTSEFLDYWLPRETPLSPALVEAPLQEKLAAVQAAFPAITMEAIFPFKAALSPAISFQAFVCSLFTQPRVFFYHFHDDTTKLSRDLQQAQISFDQVQQRIFSVDGGTSLSHLPAVREGQVIIQDRSVQQILDGITISEGESWWDCCAGAGGKSLLLKYYHPDIPLWMTDSRKSILNNLKRRVRPLNLTNYRIQYWDLAISEPRFLSNKIDGIILDAPCSGSGTWARTPENIAGMDEHSIARYQAQQLQLARNAAAVLKPGGQLLYMTCSVFEQENEAVAHRITRETGLELVDTMYFNGYEHQAETLFRANLRKSG